MVNEKYISERVLSTELLSFSSALKTEIFQEKLESYIRILGKRESQNRKDIKYISDFDVHYIHNNNTNKKRESSSYFREYSVSLHKEKYEKHIRTIQELSTKNLADLFAKPRFDLADVEEIISLLKKNIDANMIKSFEQNIRGSLSQNLHININYYSFLSYLYILPSKKIQKSDIAIDTNSGKIIIFYNSDKAEFSSRKMSIVANEKDFTVTVISRENGLAKFSGTYVSKFPDGYHKIESLMETLA